MRGAFLTSPARLMVSGEELHLVSSILPRTYSCTPLSATCYLIVKFRPIYLVYIGSRLAVRQQYGKIQGLSVEVTSCWCFLSPPPTTSVLPIFGAGSRSVLFSVRILLTTLSSTLSLHCARGSALCHSAGHSLRADSYCETSSSLSR